MAFCTRFQLFKLGMNVCFTYVMKISFDCLWASQCTIYSATFCLLQSQASKGHTNVLFYYRNVKYMVWTNRRLSENREKSKRKSEDGFSYLQK